MSIIMSYQHCNHIIYQQVTTRFFFLSFFINDYQTHEYMKSHNSRWWLYLRYRNYIFLFACNLELNRFPLTRNDHRLLIYPIIISLTTENYDFQIIRKNLPWILRGVWKFIIIMSSLYNIVASLFFL